MSTKQSIAASLAAIARLAKGGIKMDAEGAAEPAPVLPEDDEDDEDAPEAALKRVYIPIEKANEEQQTVTGVVLRPEITDAQGDIYDSDVIRKAAHEFLANYNRGTKLGLQHKEFKTGRFALVESYLAPMDFALGTSLVHSGSWVMTVKVLDPKIWALVKSGKIAGFSIGGKAKVQQLP